MLLHNWDSAEYLEVKGFTQEAIMSSMPSDADGRHYSHQTEHKASSEDLSRMRIEVTQKANTLDYQRC